MVAAAAIDLLFRNAVVGAHAGPVDVAVSNGKIVQVRPQIVADAPVFDVGGRAVIPGFVDTHIHLDKACLLGRCAHIQGGLGEAIAAVSQMKRDFSEADVYERGAKVIEKAIANGTTVMRTHVELDSRIALRSFEAIKTLKSDYAWGIDIEICVFPQEGLTNDPGTEELLVAALRDGADLLGGCPYTDTDPNAQIERLFVLARYFDVDLDFHLDFDLDPSWMHLHEICRQTKIFGWSGRVAIGHVTKLSMVDPLQLQGIANLLRLAGVALTVLPATDIYLMGRNVSHAQPRGVAPAHLLSQQGVTCSLATNNVLNPFTPFGDASLLRMANFYAHVAQCAPAAFPSCIDLVTGSPARLMRLASYGIAEGNPADLVILNANSLTDALAEIAYPIAGFKRGRQTFDRPDVRLLRPD